MSHRRLFCPRCWLAVWDWRRVIGRVLSRMMSADATIIVTYQRDRPAESRILYERLSAHDMTTAQAAEWHDFLGMKAAQLQGYRVEGPFMTCSVCRVEFPKREIKAHWLTHSAEERAEAHFQTHSAAVRAAASARCTCA